MTRIISTQTADLKGLTATQVAKFEPILQSLQSLSIDDRYQLGWLLCKPKYKRDEEERLHRTASPVNARGIPLWRR